VGIEIQEIKEKYVISISNVWIKPYNNTPFLYLKLLYLKLIFQKVFWYRDNYSELGLCFKDI